MTHPPSAERSRRYRARRRQGAVVIPVEVDQGALEALAQYAFLEDADEADRAKVAEAVGLLLFALAEGAVDVDYEHFGASD